DGVCLPDRQDAQRQRVEIVRQADRDETERPREVPLVEDPGQVGGLRPPVGDGPGHPETGVGREAPALVALVLLADGCESRILPAVVPPCAREIDAQRGGGLAGRYHIGDGEHGFRAPDVPREHLHDAAQPNRCDLEDQATSAAPGAPLRTLRVAHTFVSEPRGWPLPGGATGGYMRAIVYGVAGAVLFAAPMAQAQVSRGFPGAPSDSNWSATQGRTVGTGRNVVTGEA